MEKQLKPLPNDERLMYHGTVDKPDIKIFVSHRIDLDSETIDNPLYIPVRCGAVYDEREDVTMLGDDTGDNISEKRNSFCELTVLYWAWKNIKADYYGLCHYRRYISFNNEFPKKNSLGIYGEKWLDFDSIKKYNLNEKIMRDEIAKFDAIFTSPEDLIHSTSKGLKSFRDMTEDRKWAFDKDALELLIEIVNKKYPEYSDDLKDYLNSGYAQFYNCFIMKKELFDKFCSFCFDVIFALDNSLDFSDYTLTQTRIPGIFAEILFGVFRKHLEKNKNENYNFTEKQLVFFKKTERLNNELLPAFETNNNTVVLCSSDFFVPYTSCVILSIIEKSSITNNYDIVIFTNDISDMHKNVLLSLIEERNNFSIRFFDPSHIIKNYKLPVMNYQLLSEVTFYRVLAPYILSKHERLVILDCDLILTEDISRLHQMNLHNNTLGMVADAVWHGWYKGANPTLLDYCKEKFPIKNPANYCNTGVILVDCNKYREKITAEGMLDFLVNGKFMIQEQDGLSLLFEDDVEFLDYGWNTYITTNQFLMDSIMVWAPLNERNLYMEAVKNPKIIHWASHPKPWEQPDVLYAEKFFYYARKSPFYELIMARLGQIVAHAEAAASSNISLKSFIKKIMFHLPFGKKIWNGMKKIFKRH